MFYLWLTMFYAFDNVLQVFNNVENIVNIANAMFNNVLRCLVSRDCRATIGIINRRIGNFQGQGTARQGIDSLLTYFKLVL